MKKNALRKLRANFLRYLLLAIGTVVCTLPMIYMISTSLRPNGALYEYPPRFFPKWEALTLENYQYILSQSKFYLNFLNSVFVSLSSVVLAALVSSAMAFVMGKFHFRGKKLLFLLCLSTMMIPAELLIIQNFITISKLGWMDTFQGIILPTVASGFYIYMMREYFMQIPSILYKAAKVDGCSDWRYLWKVMIPMNKNAIATIGILAFISQWNSFVWPLMVTKSDAHRVMPIGLLHFRDAVSSQVNLQMAGATIVIVPMLIFFLVFRKQIIAGVARGGIKG